MLRWQRLPEMERLGDFCSRTLVASPRTATTSWRFGVVESVHATIKGVIRRARGTPNEPFLVLKLKWATARPIRNARDYAAFIHAEPLHSNR